MFCRNCGVAMNPGQVVCVKCGVPTGSGMSFCATCGGAVTPGAAVCLKCGMAIPPAVSPAPGYAPAPAPGYAPIPGTYLNGKDKMTMALICFFLGGLGIHNFMLGEQKKGIVKILANIFFFLGGILALIDLIKILTDKYVVDPNALL